MSWFMVSYESWKFADLIIGVLYIIYDRWREGAREYQMGGGGGDV